MEFRGIVNDSFKAYSMKKERQHLEGGRAQKTKRDRRPQDVFEKSFGSFFFFLFFFFFFFSIYLKFPILLKKRNDKKK